MPEVGVDHYRIWIEAEEWADSWDPIDCNSDVKVSFNDGAEWVATFFTYNNILTLFEKNKETGECLDGKYFWATDMILIDVLTRERIEAVVAHLIKEDEFRQIFQLCNKP